MRSPTSEVGESFSVLRDSLSVLEENKTMKVLTVQQQKTLLLGMSMLVMDNGYTLIQMCESLMT